MADQLPLWLGAAAALGIPLLAFAGSVAGQVLSRRDARDLDVRWQREETMRLLRWAAELASEQGARGVVGIATLEALTDSALVQRADEPIVAAIFASVISSAKDSYAEEDLVEEAD